MAQPSALDCFDLKITVGRWLCGQQWTTQRVYSADEKSRCILLLASGLVTADPNMIWERIWRECCLETQLVAYETLAFASFEPEAQHNRQAVIPFFLIKGV